MDWGRWFEKVRGIDTSLVFIIFTLLGLGIIMIFDTSALGSGLQDRCYFLKKHGIFLAVGLLLMVAIVHLRLDVLQRLGPCALFLAVFFLVLVLVPQVGTFVRGSRRSLRLGPIGFQPSEIAKLCLILYLAGRLGRNQGRIRKFSRGAVPPIIVATLLAGLIVAEPDFGVASLTFLVAFIILFLAGARIMHLGAIGCMGGLAGAYFLLSEPYRLERLLVYLNPWVDPRGSGWQLGQSLVALGSGGWLGKGLGYGLQKFGYLPQAHTDFIFSIVGEELGFMGVAATVLLFVCFVWQGTKIAHQADSLFGHLLAMGITVMIGLQAAIHIGVAVKFFPTTGITLPFISYGGSSLVCTLIAVGILLNVSRHRRT